MIKTTITVDAKALERLKRSIEDYNNALWMRYLALYYWHKYRVSMN